VPSVGPSRGKAPDRTHRGRHHEPGLPLDQDRHRQWPDRSLFVGLLLVEQEGAIRWQLGAQVGVQVLARAGHLAQLAQHGVDVEMQQAPCLPEADAAGEQGEQGGVALRLSIPAVVSERLA
jgi:hypothetical protein